MAIIGLCLLLLLVFVVVCEALGWPFLKQPLTSIVSKKIEREVQIDGPFKIRFLGSIRLQAGKLWISAPTEFNVPHLVQAKNVELKLRYRDLFNIKDGDAYLIKAISAEYLDARLTRYEDGRSTWQFKKDPNEPIRPFPIIQTLIIQHGKAVVDDALTQAQLQIVFDTKEDSLAEQSNNQQSVSNITAHGKFRGSQLDSKLTTQGFLPIAAQTEKSFTPVSSKGWLQYGRVFMRFDGSINDLFGNQKIKGKLDIKGNSLGELGNLLSITLPTTSPFRIAGEVERNTAGWFVDIKSASFGQSQLYGKFEYLTNPDYPLLRGTLKGKKFVLADLAPAFGANTDDKGKPRTRVFPEKNLDFATYNRMNAEIRIDLDYIDLGNAFREPIAPFRASLDLNKNKLSLAEIDARTAQGSISGNIFIDAHAQKNNISNPKEDKNNPKLKPDWAINLHLKNIKLEKWLTVSEERKKAVQKSNSSNPPPQNYITGLMNASLKVKGKGNSTAELLRTLNGEVFLNVQNGEISRLILEAVGLDIAQALGLLLKGDHNLEMQCALMDFKADKGILQSNVAIVDTSKTTLLLDGDVNLGEEKLGLTITAEPKNFSPFTVRSPIDISGTFLAPKVSPHAEPIAARVVGGALLALINPLAAIIPFMDPGDADDSDSNCANTLQQLQKKTPQKNDGAKKTKPQKSEPESPKNQGLING